MLKLIVKWLFSASALLFVAYVYSGVQIPTFGAAMIAALVIGLLNAVVRPVLVVLTLSRRDEPSAAYTAIGTSAAKRPACTGS